MNGGGMMMMTVEGQLDNSADVVSSDDEAH